MNGKKSRKCRRDAFYAFNQIQKNDAELLDRWRSQFGVSNPFRLIYKAIKRREEIGAVLVRLDAQNQITSAARRTRKVLKSTKGRESQLQKTLRRSILAKMREAAGVDVLGDLSRNVGEEISRKVDAEMMEGAK
jgi:predicted GNAT family acetyltransferase